MEWITKLLSFLKQNHVWVRIYKPNEITDPLTRGMDKNAEAIRQGASLIENALRESSLKMVKSSSIDLTETNDLLSALVKEMKKEKKEEVNVSLKIV